MLKLYTHLYAWAYLRNERQWGKGHDHAWAALCGVSILAMLNVGTIVAMTSAICNFHIGEFLKAHSTDTSLAVVVGIPLFVWLLVQRTGRGPRLVDTLREASVSSKRKMERKLLLFLVGSLVMFVVSGVCLALARRH